MRLIIATKNKSKLKEMCQILKGLDLEIVSLGSLKKKIRIVENGKTFKENAMKKALPVSRAYGRDYVIGEDSGLSVDFLEGAPGIYSKRYAGKSGNQVNNNKKLLAALNRVPLGRRQAFFSCTLALAKKGKILEIFEGKLHGQISSQEKGNSGFGYDPVFYLSQYRKTVAQMPLAKKNRISHRARAFRKLKKYFLIQVNTDKNR